MILYRNNIQIKTYGLALLFEIIFFMKCQFIVGMVVDIVLIAMVVDILLVAMVVIVGRSDVLR